MPTELMPPQTMQSPPTSPPLRRGFEPTVREIITAARKTPVQNPAGGAWLLSAATAVLWWASFMPLDWGPLAWVALVPLMLLVRSERKTRWMYTAIYVGGFLSMLALLQWMRLGDPTMYLAWVGLAIYMAIYFPLFVALSRAAVHRFSIPLAVAAPVVWVGLEFIRGHLGTGFAWYNLSHTQYRWVELIQVSDLVGAYGVSFVVAMMAACMARLVPVSVLTRLKLQPEGGPEPAAGRQAVSVVLCLSLFAAVLAYGYARRAQAEFQQGPKVALIQGNFTTSLKHDPRAAQEIFNTHHRLTGMAVYPHQPDLIVWPETMYRAPLLVAPPDLSDDELMRIAPQIPPQAWRESDVPQALADMSRQAGAALVIGIDALEADAEGFRHYNSAAFVRPDVGLGDRYDKLHRVVFGEYMPLKEHLPWLHKLTPFPADFGLTAGEGAVVFSHQDWRFAPLICFEDTVPHLVRNIVDVTADTEQGRQPVDCLINLTNDGWFHGSSGLDQHLITAVFRSVECRTPMVRAVNTGISAIIDGDGMVVEPEVFLDADEQGRTSMRDPQTGHWHRQLNAVLIDTIPLDDRGSLYVEWGDWFAGGCCFFAMVLMFGGVIPRSGRKSSPEK